MNWYITGDKHGDFSALFSENPEILENSDNAVIVLGDAGVNYYLDKRDNHIKEALNNVGCLWYIVYGNHESRPSRVYGMCHIYDLNVSGWVWYQSEYPNIRYFDDYGIYTIHGLKTAVIGGAYSVDKYYRLERGWQWFPDEELSDEEMDSCAALMKGKRFDLVLTHTCPLSYEPRDLFLSFIDQSTVSKRMEEFLDKVKNNVDWGILLFGHFHADRIEAPYVEQFFHDISSLEEIIERWKRYDETGELDWWLSKSPNF